MKHLCLIIFYLAIISVSFSQPIIETRCPYKGIPVTDNRITKDADDFTITTTDGITRNLYNTLDSGKTVFVDLFYTTCSWCQTYAPVIEEIYQNTGAGQEDIVFWGISNNLFDTNWIIDQYRQNYNVSNPCAGPWGGGTTAFSIVISGQNFYGFPTYCVICPDRTLFFDPCYPPVVDGFDPYFEQCAETIGIDDNNPEAVETGILYIFPNPAKDVLSLEILSKTSNPVTIELYNLLGKKVLSNSFEIIPASQTLTFPVDLLPAGTYFIKLIRNGLMVDTQKVLISR